MAQTHHISPVQHRPRWQKFRDQILEMRPFATSLSPWPGGAATSINLPPTRLIPGDPDFGHAIYSKRLSANELGQFAQLSWLRHIMASGKSLHAIYAAGLLQSWTLEQQSSSFGAEAARALIALATDAPLIAARIQSFETILLPMATAQAKRVFTWAPRNPIDKTLRGAALLITTIAFNGLQHLQDTASLALDEGLAGTVLPDGGHFSRSSDELLKLLMLLVPLRRALIVANQTVPDGLHQAIERMFPMLRMLCHGDGGLSHFGGARSHIEVNETILRADQNNGAPLQFAPYAAIARLQQSQTLLLADCGDAGLPIEISRSECRFFASQIDTGHTQNAAPADVQNVAGGTMLRMSAGTEVTRDIYLSQSGSNVRGEDAFPPDSHVRIQFADDVSVLEVAAHEIRFMAADTSLWVLAQRGGVFEQGTEYQRVIRLDADDPTRPSRIVWALRQMVAE
jgi:uncharacterized heparinase superfamily protein